jgi:hypothetical protein
LKFYGLYKQATEGPCSSPQPGFFDVVGKYKWEAWKQLSHLERSDAMQQYVESVLRKASDMPPSALLTRFVEAVTPVQKKRPDSSALPFLSQTNDSSTNANSSSSSASRAVLDESVAEKADVIASQIDQLRSVVEQDSLKIVRLQQSLEGGTQEVQMRERTV